jgi:hypothetical protein
MTIPEAKAILMRARAGIPVIEDPEMAQAMELARQSPELGAWFDAHLAAQKTIAAGFRAIAAPAGLREQILASAPQNRHSRKFNPWIIAAAAALALLLSLAGFYLKPGSDETLAGFQARMASFALREYSMDIVTNEASVVRNYLKTHNAPSEFPLPAKLVSAEVKGGAKLLWQNHPVAMVCFKLDAKETLYLFVLDEHSIQRKPARSQPELQQFSRLTAATWREDGKIYFLAAETSPEVLRTYIAGVTLGAWHHALPKPFREG